ncbi:MAG TPA: hypothetical protein VHH35_17440, partial [Pyrinomonadaceae bacterium]|nr:hypothetical protein [Pyrinomonadaceae bacterium]
MAVFWAPQFPSIQGCGVTRDILQQALTDFTVQYLTESELIARLNTTKYDLFVNPYGSAFPKRAWPALLKYLRGGGNWLNLGGVPLSRPVVADGPGWRAESHQTAYHKQLGITHSFPVKGSVPDVDFNARIDEVYELYMRLSSSNSEPDEAGSDGPREGFVEPLIAGKTAAPVIQIDRMEAEFAGGRWVFANFSGTIESSAARALAGIAAQGARRFEVRSNFACYREGETPSLTVRL